MQYQKEEVRDRIEKAAFELFEKEGYYKTNMKQIAKIANISIGNLYRYFLSKRELYDALMVDVQAALRLFCEASEVRFETEASHDFLDSWVDDLQKVYAKYKRELDLLSAIGNEEFETFWDKIIYDSCKNWTLKRNAESTAEDAYISKLFTIGLINGLLKILRETNGDDRTILIKKWMGIHLRSVL